MSNGGASRGLRTVWGSGFWPWIWGFGREMSINAADVSSRVLRSSWDGTGPHRPRTARTPASLTALRPSFRAAPLPGFPSVHPSSTILHSHPGPWQGSPTHCTFVWEAFTQRGPRRPARL